MKMYLPITIIGFAVASFFSPKAISAGGESVYQKSCANCHDQGMFGAPRLGFRQDWDQRLSKGPRLLVRNAIQGFQGQTGFMPPRGGDNSLSDSEVESAVKFMTDKAW